MQGRKRRPDFLGLMGASPNPKGRGKKGRAVPPPIHLSEGAKRAWKQFEAILREMGAFQPDYAVPLERCCELYADIIDLQREIKDGGRFYKTTNKAGDVMIRPHPAAGQLADADRRLATYLSEFGLTPAGRAKLLTGKKPDRDSDRDSAEEFFG